MESQWICYGIGGYVTTLQRLTTIAIPLVYYLAALQNCFGTNMHNKQLKFSNLHMLRLGTPLTSSVYNLLVIKSLQRVRSLKANVLAEKNYLPTFSELSYFRINYFRWKKFKLKRNSDVLNMDRFQFLWHICLNIVGDSLDFLQLGHLISFLTSALMSWGSSIFSSQPILIVQKTLNPSQQVSYLLDYRYKSHNLQQSHRVI